MKNAGTTGYIFTVIVLEYGDSQSTKKVPNMCNLRDLRNHYNFPDSAFASFKIGAPESPSFHKPKKVS
jgi:hypothetical protein